MNRKDQIKNMLEANPSDSFLRFAYAKELEKCDDIDTAISWYTKIVNDDPSYVGVYYHLAKAYELIEDSQQALSTYEKGIQTANELKDLHALSELKSAKLNLELEL